jgi:hypothetical protein
MFPSPSFLLPSLLRSLFPPYQLFLQVILNHNSRVSNIENPDLETLTTIKSEDFKKFLEGTEKTKDFKKWFI